MVNKQCNYDDIVDACKRAGVHDDIMKLSLNYKTKLGADGVSLSNGQMQKLNFARAYLKRGSLILLDEIDSGLDGKAEKNLIQNLQNLSKKNIVVMITHRKNLLIHADRVFLIENGAIKESGKHDYLIRYCMEYQKLFEKC